MLFIRLETLKNLKPNTEIEIKLLKRSKVTTETIISNDPFCFEVLCTSATGVVNKRDYTLIKKILNNQSQLVNDGKSQNASIESIEDKNLSLTKKEIKLEVWKNYETSISKPTSQKCLVCQNELGKEIVNEDFFFKKFLIFNPVYPVNRV